VHRLKRLQHIHVGKDRLRRRSHQSAHGRKLQGHLLRNSAVHHVLEGEDAHQRVVLNDQGRLPRLGHLDSSVADVSPGTHHHGLLVGQDGPQSRHRSVTLHRSGEQRTKQLTQRGGLGASDPGQSRRQRLAASVRGSPAISTFLLLQPLQLADGLVQALGDVQKADHRALLIQYRQVAEVVLHHGAQGVHGAVAHRDALGVGSHHAIDRGRVIKVLRDDPPHDVRVAHDARQPAVLAHDQSRVAALLAEHLANRQDAVVRVTDQGLLGPELAHGVLVLRVLALALNLLQRSSGVGTRLVIGSRTVLFVALCPNNRRLPSPSLSAAGRKNLGLGFDGREGHRPLWDFYLSFHLVGKLGLLLGGVLGLDLIKLLLKARRFGEVLFLDGLRQNCLSIDDLCLQLLASGHAFAKGFELVQVILLVVCDLK